MFYNIMRVIFRIWMRYFLRARVSGVENVPKEGAVILCSNHRSNYDPILVAAPLDRKVRYMAKAELFKVPLLKPIISSLGAYPVQRGNVSRETIRTTLQILREGQVLCIFPEGTRSDLSGEGKKGAASFALKTGATVVPALIDGRVSLFSRIRIVYGPPVDLSEFAAEKTTSEMLEQATNKIMNAIKQLKD